MSERAIALASWTLAVVLIVSLAYMTARMTWHLGGETGQPLATSIGANAYRSPAPPPDLTSILSLQPFGAISAPETSLPEAKETDLGLVLHGVVLAAPSAASIALIASTNKKIEAYGIGDPVADGASLQEVMPDKVILLVNGQRETLSFPKEVVSSGVAKLRSLVPDSVADNTNERIDNSATAVIERYRQRIAANPKTVLDNLGVSVTEQGYQIGQQPAAGVRRAGLRPGDIVARVNGENVGNIEDDRRLFDKVAASGRARVEVIRDGQRIIMSFPLR